MKDFFAANGRTIARVSAVIVLYVFAKFFPLADKEREAIETLTEVLGLAVLGLMPGLRLAKRKDDPQ